jgi:hypothetical protein
VHLLSLSSKGEKGARLPVLIKVMMNEFKLNDDFCEATTQGEMTKH